MINFFWFLSGASLVALASWLIQESVPPPVAVLIEGIEGWQHVLHTSYNAFFTWRIDPVADLAAPLLWPLAPSYSVAASAVSLLILYCGMFMLLCTDGRCGGAAAALSSAFLCMGMLLLYGWDLLVIQSVAWWPLVCAAFLGAARVSAALGFAGAAIGILPAIFLAFAANQLSIPLALFGAWFTANALTSQSRLASVFVVSGGLALVFAGAALINAPMPIIPDYPPFSHVVPDDGLPGNIMPLIGSFSPIPIIDRAAVRDLFAMPALFAAVLCLPLLITASRESRSLLLLLLISLAAVLSDCWAPEHIAQILPLEVLPRLIPGTAYFPLTPIVFALSLIVFVYILAAEHRTVHLIASFLVLTGIAFNEKSLRIDPLSSGSLQLKHGREPLAALSSLLAERRITPQYFQAAIDLLISPSYYLVRNTGIHVLTRRDLFESTLFIPCALLDLKISASHNGDKTDKMCDERDASRWSPMGGAQNGGESITLEFPGPTRIQGIELATGKFPADFPRALRLECAQDCSDDGYESILQIPSYQGEIKYTDSGHPYYAGQDQVKIIFPRPFTCRCLRAVQIGKIHAFDWSVAELRILLEQ